MSDEPLSRGEQTQAMIIRAAHQLFVAQGYHGTSMRQIARKAGISLGNIYNHFSSKEEIFAAVFMENHPYRDVLPALESAQGESVEEVVRDAARRMVMSLGERTDFLNLMFIELVEFKGQHVPQLFQSAFPGVMSFVQRFSSRHGVLRQIPLPIIVRVFVGLFFSYFITELLLASQMLPEMRQNALDYFIDIFLYGILAKKEESE